jgi:hypothetical protein
LRWRTLLGSALATCALLGLHAGPALGFDNTTDTALTIDSDAHWWNTAETKTLGGYQYVLYWDATSPVYLKITRRRLSDDRLDDIRFDVRGAEQILTNENDGHNALTLGISPTDGRLHISWSPHNLPHHYGISSAGCTSEATFSNCRFTFSDHQANRSTEGTRLTYPHYFNDSAGHLYMYYRYGSSQDGDQYLNSYNDDGTWTDVGLILRGRGNTADCRRPTASEAGCFTIRPVWGTEDARYRGPYIWGFAFDKNDRLHLLWNWREHASRSVGGEGWLQHDLYYVYSDDFGRTWNDNGGTRVATAGSDPVRVLDTSTQALAIPNGTNFSGYDVELDSHNQPHSIINRSDVTVASDEPHLVNIRQMHIWRSTSGTWYSGYIDPAGTYGTFGGWGGLMFDRADDLYYIYPQTALGWVPWNADIYDQLDLGFDRVTWQGGEYLNVDQMSSTSAIDTYDPVATSISSAGNSQVRIRIRNNTARGTTAYLYFTTTASPAFDPARGNTVAVTTRDGSYRDYTIDMSRVAGWTGTLKDLELYPAHGDTTGSVSIDYIRVTDSAGRIAKSWEFRAGTKVLAAQASPTNNWSTWTIYDLLPGLSDTWSDGLFPIDKQRYADGTGDGKKVTFPVTEQGSPGIESLVLHDFDITGDTVSKFWNYDVDTQGWTATNHVSSFRWESDGGTNSISGTITGNDSQLKSPDNLEVKVDGDFIHVRLKNTSAATTARVYFITDADGTFDATKSKTFTITANSGYTDYTIDMSRVSGWSGQTLRQLRLDPSDDATTRGSFKVGRVYIDRT